MSTRDELRKIISAVQDDPADDVLERAIELAHDVCERQYVKGMKMQAQLTRIRLGLAIESDG